jgi:tellurite methyltransferase
MEYPGGVGEHYDKLYRGEDHDDYAGSMVSEGVFTAARFLRTGAAMDLGAGEGRNALYLAERGFKTTAIDISAEGIEKIKRRAEAQGIKLEAEVRDVTKIEFGNHYDLLVANFLFHFMSREDGLQLIRKMQGHTLDGGLNVITAFTTQGELDGENSPNLYFRPGELKELYRGWQIIKYDESEVPTIYTKPDGQQKNNHRVLLVARMPVL